MCNLKLQNYFNFRSRVPKNQILGHKCWIIAQKKYKLSKRRRKKMRKSIRKQTVKISYRSWRNWFGNATRNTKESLTTKFLNKCRAIMLIEEISRWCSRGVIYENLWASCSKKNACIGSCSTPGSTLWIEFYSSGK